MKPRSPVRMKWPRLSPMMLAWNVSTLSAGRFQ
jgi:hypothetical protein